LDGPDRAPATAHKFFIWNGGPKPTNIWSPRATMNLLIPRCFDAKAAQFREFLVRRNMRIVGFITKDFTGELLIRQ
jgi:hypothetical protein